MFTWAYYLEKDKYHYKDYLTHCTPNKTNKWKTFEHQQNLCDKAMERVGYFSVLK